MPRINVTGHSVIWIIVILAGAYAAFLVLMYFFQAVFVYFPSKQIILTPEERGLAYEDVYLYATDQTRLNGWYVPAEQNRGTLLFFHGNAGNISGRVESIELFNKLGLNVLIIDYRGYGRSEGTPSENGTYMDAEAAWRYITEVQGESPDRIILFGRSLGGGVAAWLASNVEAGALVLESTFTSAVDLAREIYPFVPVQQLMHIRYPVGEYLEEITMPVMVAHSREDEVIPFHHGRELFDKAGEPKKWLEMQGGHNDGFLLAGNVYLHAWDEFLRNNIDK